MCSNFISFLSIIFFIFSKCVYCVHEDFSGADNSTLIISVQGDYLPFLHNSILVKPGDINLEIFCTGPKADSLTMYAFPFDDRTPLPKRVLNATTIVVPYESVQENSLYSDFMVVYCNDRGKIKEQSLFVTIDDGGVPDLLFFHCVTKNLISYNCTWGTYNNTVAGFSLYSPSDSAAICNIPKHEVKSKFSCAWDTNKTLISDTDIMTPFQLSMVYCSYRHCANTTFQFKPISIVKFDPPIIISYEKYRSHGKDHYNIDFKISTISPGLFQHTFFDRLEVRYWVHIPSEMRTRTAYAQVKIKDYYEVTSIYRVQLPLPCNTFRYEVTLSVKTLQAMGEEYWSDTSSFYVSGTDNDENGCELELPVSPDKMLYEVNEFKAKFIEEQTLLKSVIKKLNDVLIPLIQYFFKLDIR